MVNGQISEYLVQTAEKTKKRADELQAFKERQELYDEQQKAEEFLEKAHAGNLSKQQAYARFKLK